MKSDISARVGRLEDIHEIRTLKHVYMAYCDLGYPPQKLGPLFTDDAVWTSDVFGHHEGRAAIEAFFAGVSSRIVFAAHLALNGIIEVDGDTATGTWRMLMPCTMEEDGRKVGRWILGDYDETYARRNGVWRFSRIDFFINFNITAEESWVGAEAIRA